MTKAMNFDFLVCIEKMQTWLFSQDNRFFVTAVVFMVLGALLEHGCWVLWRNAKLRHRIKKGAAAEKHAMHFLEQRGYHILDAQLQKYFTVEVNGEKQKMVVRADYLVRKGRKTYVVEVKSGKQGDVALTHVRRQLLEYNMVFHPDGIILLDMANRNLQQIQFHYPSGWNPRKIVRLIVLVAVSLFLARIII